MTMFRNTQVPLRIWSYIVPAVADMNTITDAVHGAFCFVTDDNNLYQWDLPTGTWNKLTISGIDDVLGVAQILTSPRTIDADIFSITINSSDIIDIGGITAGGTKIRVDVGGALVFIDSDTHDNKVGINQASPTVALDVVGDIKGSGKINLAALPVYADEAAAVTGGLNTGDIYQTTTGELRIKL